MTFMVSEIFLSVQGESSFSGFPCVFIRLTGCNLNCRYCDTQYAKTDGTETSLSRILDRVSGFGTELVEITGGEPLLQSNTPALASALQNMGHEVLVETNGSFDISVLPEGVIRIMDLKCPSSGESDKMFWENLRKLRPDDEVKFVIADRYDYEWVKDVLAERFAHTKTKILLSTVYGELPPRLLITWMLKDRLKARFQLQIHKFIWPHDARGV